MAATSTVKWYGPRVTREIRAEMRSRLNVAGIALAMEVKRNIAVQGPPSSVPGEFPHKLSGDLQKGVHAKMDHRALRITVTSSAPHTEYVEKARPFCGGLCGR